MRILHMTLFFCLSHNEKSVSYGGLQCKKFEKQWCAVPDMDYKSYWILKTKCYTIQASSYNYNYTKKLQIWWCNTYFVHLSYCRFFLMQCVYCNHKLHTYHHKVKEYHVGKRQVRVPCLGCKVEPTDYWQFLLPKHSECPLSLHVNESVHFQNCHTAHSPSWL